MKSRYEKLMAVANDPNATPAEREAYRAKAEKVKGSTRNGLHSKDAHEWIMRGARADDQWFVDLLVSKQIIDATTGHVARCACPGPGKSMKECAAAGTRKTPCPCACHPRTGRKAKNS